MSVIISDKLNDWSRQAAMSLLSSGEEIIQLPEADSFYIGRSKRPDMLCIGKVNVEGADFFVLQKK